MREIVLDLQDLTWRFGAFTAIDRSTLSVNSAEVFGLFGSNGAGKTHNQDAHYSVATVVG